MALTWGLDRAPATHQEAVVQDDAAYSEAVVQGALRGMGSQQGHGVTTPQHPTTMASWPRAVSFIRAGTAVSSSLDSQPPAPACPGQHFTWPSVPWMALPPVCLEAMRVALPSSGVGVGRERLASVDSGSPGSPDPATFLHFPAPEPLPVVLCPPPLLIGQYSWTVCQLALLWSGFPPL